MPVLTSEQQAKKPKQRKLRNAEYYDMESTFDKLYAGSKKGKTFSKLMEIIESEENTVLFVGKIPDECRKQFPDDFWRFYSHNCNVWIGKSNNKKLPL